MPLDEYFCFKNGRVEGVSLITFPDQGKHHIQSTEYRRWGLKDPKYFKKEFTEDDKLVEERINYEDLPEVVKTLFAAETRQGAEEVIKQRKLYFSERKMSLFDRVVWESFVGVH